jgi:1-deoxy-D-xylulose-5-phosphate reductoisomerase
MTKQISILGSTGSIGKNALQVIDSLGADYQVCAISAQKSYALLAEQAKKYKPKYVAITDSQYAKPLQQLLPNFDGQILVGPDSLEEIAQIDEADTIITAVVGAAGLPATLKAAKCGKTLAIANKEPLVIAGQILTETAKKHNAKILPIDSEHSAIFQALQAGRIEDVSKIILTASGGPFRKATPEQFQNATLDQALTHPTWNMGPKITIDSATMMNKALEIIEAVWLFNIDIDKIEVLIHPESIIHSMVEFVDGSVVAQMGTPDMCVPIQYALTYPKRCKGIAKHLEFDKIGKMTFEKPNLDIFTSLKLGIEVARQGGSAPVVFNAANEVAVEQFLAGNIKFAMIMDLIDKTLQEHNIKSNISLDELLQADAWARQKVLQYINNS